MIQDRTSEKRYPSFFPVFFPFWTKTVCPFFFPVRHEPFPAFFPFRTKTAYPFFFPILVLKYAPSFSPSGRKQHTPCFSPFSSLKHTPLLSPFAFEGIMLSQQSYLKPDKIFLFKSKERDSFLEKRVKFSAIYRQVNS
ncbi:MAG: hypothetical protein KIC77_06520 [Clostridiales bacterium]|nr:hypothetical protein [Clostridiales bacterium]